MARKPQENPQLDMTPMIDVVFELIIFFVVTLTEAEKKDETIELEDGQHGTVLTADQLPPDHMQIDIASFRVNKATGKPIFEPRISIADKELSLPALRQQVKLRQDRYGRTEFPIFIRADYAVPHKAVKEVMDVCTDMGIWQFSILAVADDKTDARKRLGSTVKRK